MPAHSKYEPEFCAKLIEHMRGGLSFESFAGLVGVNKTTMYSWETKHPEFKEAHELGVSLSLLWWEKMGRAAMVGEDATDANGKRVSFKNFNTTIWIFSMKNRFGWRDRQDVEHTIVEPTVIRLPMAKEVITIEQRGGK